MLPKCPGPGGCFMMTPKFPGGARQMFGRDLSHHLAAGFELPPPIEGQCEHEGAAEVVGVHRTEGFVWHGRSLAAIGEQSKNYDKRSKHRRPLWDCAVLSN